MKKVCLLLMSIGMLFCMPAHAQFFAKMELMTPHYYPGEVYFVDGHHESYAEVELPRVGKDKLSVRKNADDEKRTSIEAIDIIGIKIWHKDFPDKTHVLHYVFAKKTMLQDDNQWGYPVAGSTWGVVYQCEQNYLMNKETGEIEIVKFRGGDGPDTPTLFYLKRAGQETADLLAFDNKFPNKKKIAALFQENQSVYEGVKSGKLKMVDIQYILDEMAGGKKLEQPAEPQIEATKNGATGDDE